MASEIKRNSLSNGYEDHKHRTAANMYISPHTMSPHTIVPQLLVLEAEKLINLIYDFLISKEFGGSHTISRITTTTTKAICNL